jgi:hypothetical protein
MANRFSLQKVLAPLLHTNVSCGLQETGSQGGTMIAAAMKQQSDGTTENHLDSVVAKELDQLQRRVAEAGKGEFFFYLTDSAKGLLLLEANLQQHDLRRLKLAIERLVVYPLANLFATDRIQVGDMIRIDWDRDQPGFDFISEPAPDASPL